MKTTHSVFLVPGIIPLIFVFLLGWTDVDVFHVNWTCWPVTSMDPFIIWKIVPFSHCIVTLTTTPHLVITVILTSMHNLQPVCIDILVYELIMKAETACIILENHCMLTWLVAQEDLLFKTLLSNSMKQSSWNVIGHSMSHDSPCLLCIQ